MSKPRGAPAYSSSPAGNRPAAFSTAVGRYARNMRVVLMTRRPRPDANFSVELIVQGLVENLGPDFSPSVVTSRFFSNGILPRAYNAFEVMFKQGDVNHITGDVHFLAYFLNKSKTVLTVLDCGRIAGNLDFRKRLIRLLWFQIPVRRCSAVTVISHAVKQDLLRHVRIHPDKVHVVPVAVPTLYSHVPKEFNAQRPVILQIGSGPNKNLPRLIEALAGLPCKLEIIGRLTDEHRSLLARFNIEHESFVSLTNEQMLERYSKCDIVAFASTFEGFGMPIIEGNLVGRPVVTGNVASMPEVAGDAACLVDPFDVTSIRDGFLRVIRDQRYRDALVFAGFANAKRYGVKNITSQYEAVYRLVAASSEFL